MSTLTFAPTVEPGAGLEPELALQTPREIPAELWTGSYARQAKKNISKLVKGGIIAIAMGGMSFVEDLASFFPLIEYSSWLGVGLLGVGAVLAVDLWVIRRRFRYVTDGVPTRVRIDDLALAPHTQSHGQPTSHRFHVWYSWRDPSNDETITCEDQSDVIKEEDRVKVTTSFRIGDEVTALHFKSNPPKTVRLYGFLGLKPDLGLVDRDDYVPSPLWMDVLGTAAIWLFIALTVWNVYALRRFDPISASPWHWLPCGIGSLLVGGGGTWLIAAAYRGFRDVTNRQNQQAIKDGTAIDVTNEVLKPGIGVWFMFLIFIAGGIGLGGLVGWNIACTANSALDRSEAIVRPVEIVSLSVDDKRVFRFHFVDYQFEDEPENKHSLQVSGDAYEQLQARGLAEVKQGAFGWSWVQSIKPRP